MIAPAQGQDKLQMLVLASIDKLPVALNIGGASECQSGILKSSPQTSTKVESIG